MPALRHARSGRPRRPIILIALLLGLLSSATAGAADGKALLNETDFRDRVYACWLGKTIGGTLGMPFEGKRTLNNVTFYTDLKPGEPAANDDLDLQILWLKAMEDNGGRVDARILGGYWMKFVPVDWNEYGVGKSNMRMGLLPPVSGEFNNDQWKNSNGAWIRSEIWACLAPGVPALAARMAREDACVDHGAAEGTLAEIFTASVESAAFVEPDRDALIAFGLSMIPQDCRVAKAVRAAVRAKREKKDWQAARLDVMRVTEDTGWFQAPRNIGFTVIGWLFGEADFGKSICIAVNCGDDTDCTAATLGSILGIIGGTKAIPAAWREPIGSKIKTIAVSGFEIPPDLAALTDRTVAMTKIVLASSRAPVEITDGAADLRSAVTALAAAPAEIRPIWRLSPFRVVWRELNLVVEVDYRGEPEIRSGVPRTFEVKVTNLTDSELPVRISLQGVPIGWQVKGFPDEEIELKTKAERTIMPRISAPTVAPGIYLLRLDVTALNRTYTIPLTLICPKS